MATKLNKSEKITLRDGRVVELRPLNIKRLRKFMGITQEFPNAKKDIDGINLMVKAVQVALDATEPELATDLDYIENNFTMANVGKVMEVAGGVVLGLFNEEESAEVEAMNGDKLTVRPLVVAAMRDFMEVTEKFNDLETDEDGNPKDQIASLDIMVDAVAIALRGTEPEKAGDVDYLEENLDMDSMTRIMSVASGGRTEVEDPNLMITRA